MSNASQLTSEPKPWRVGGCYAIRRSGVLLYRGPDLLETLDMTLGLKDKVYLLAVEAGADGNTPPLGLVLPVDSGCPGWTMLEYPSVKGSQNHSEPLRRTCLKESCEVGARYEVNTLATLRKSPSLASSKVGEAQPGEEVLVLDVGVNDVDKDMWHRLRVMVRLPDGTVGWMSPLTECGDHLLDSVNLHSFEAVKRHRRSLESVRSGSWRSSLWAVVSCSRAIRAPAQLRCSFKLGQPMPWHVGGCYRVLERVPLRREPSLSSAATCRLSAGQLVTVQNVQVAECSRQGFCPCVYVEVLDGTNAGREGWVRCAAPTDSHDVLDIRDQNEYEVLLQSLTNSTEDATPDAEAEEGSSSRGSSSSAEEDDRVPGSPAPLPGVDGPEEGGDASSEQPREGGVESDRQEFQGEEPQGDAQGGQHPGPQPQKVPKKVSVAAALGWESRCGGGLMRALGTPCKPCGWAEASRAKPLSD